jgi:hypothetical protein
MSTINDLNTQFSALNDALDRVADKLADITDDALVKAALIRQYEELKKQKTNIEIQIRELEQQKILG